MKKYMVTGGCGFIGSTLVNNLLKDNNCSEINSIHPNFASVKLFDLAMSAQFFCY